jgi:hypothetical protein
MRFDIEQWWERFLEEQRKNTEERIGARCPWCDADLLPAVEAAAHDWSEGLPSTIAVWCEGCDREIEFRVEWNIELWTVNPL